MDRREAREGRRRAVRRQRIAAAATVVGAAIVAIALSIGSCGGGGRSTGTPTENAGGKTGGGTAAGARSAKVRNATPQPGWGPHTGPVPILEYHVLGEPPLRVPYPELFVSRSDFRQQMDWLERNGFQAVTLEQVETAWYHGGTLPPKPVVLSFDDGYRPQYTFAMPELRSHGWAGVLNLKAEGSDLYRSNVEAMIHAGWELAAHTIHHLDLTELGPEQLKEEVAGSRAMLQHEYGVPVDDFCYPSGRFDPTVIAAVKAAGYVGATTELPGYAERQKPYELSRFEILRSSGVTGLASDLH